MDDGAPSLPPVVAGRERLAEPDGSQRSLRVVNNEATIINIDQAPFTLWADRVRYSHRGRALLETSSLTCRSGELTVILGPSGTGKTTMLNHLTGRLAPQEGSVGVNAEAMTELISKYLINYVMAHDRMNEYLTVEETLVHTAQLKLPHRPLAECRAIARDLMKQLNLTHCAGTFVGGAWRRGISKGELKRLAVAVELIGDPCCLILDEPTTGLDSSISYELARILRSIARDRQIVVLCTLHQPNQRIFELIDSLVLMGGMPGRVIYQGPPDGAAAFLKRNGLRLDYTDTDGPVSTPDLLMDLIVGYGGTAGLKATDSRLSSCDIYQGTSIGADCSSCCSLTNSRKSPSKTSARHARQQLINRIIPQQQIVEADYGPLRGKSQIAVITDAQSWGAQLHICMRTQFISNCRNPLVLAIILLINIVQSMLLGLLFYRVDSDMSTVTTSNYLGWPIFDSPLLRFLSYGLSNQADSKVVDPLEHLIRMPPNNVTDASLPLEIAANPDLVNWLADFAKCLRSNFFLDGSEYPRWDWDASPGLDASDSAGGQCWNDVKAYDATTLGRWSVGQGMTTLTSAIQMFDMVMKNPDEWNVPVDTGALLDWFDFQSDLEPLASAVLCCGGSTWPFVTQTILADPKTCAETYPNYPLPVFPGRMYWPMMHAKLRDVASAFLELNAAPASAAPATAALRKLHEAPLPAASAPKRRLGSGIGGMVNDLFDLLMRNPDSIVFKVITLLNSYKERFESAECVTLYCRKIVEFGTQMRHVVSDLSTTLLTVLNLCSIIFFLVANLGFASYDVLLQFPKLRAVFNRERANGMYSTSSFLLAKMIADLPFQVIPGLVWGLIYWYMTGLDTEPSKVAQYVGVAALTAFSAYSMGYFVGAAVLHLETSIILSPMILICMLVLAGFFLRDAEMPVWISWARVLSIYRWSYFAVQIVQFPPGGSYGPIPNELTLMLGGVTDSSLTHVCLYLLAICVAARVCCYFCLRFLYTKVGAQA